MFLWPMGCSTRAEAALLFDSVFWGGWVTGEGWENGQMDGGLVHR